MTRDALWDHVGGRAVDVEVARELHNLRRTARRLMSRAGVASDIAERVLDHVIPGLRGIYDGHAYETEKRCLARRPRRADQAHLGAAEGQRRRLR
jgi:hypothetical protein